MKHLKVLLLAVFSLALMNLAQADSAPKRKTLSNGLTILVQENHASPVVAVRFYVRTGSLYEGKYVGAGISHLFEHVLWEGTTSMNKKQFNDAVQAIGGQSNAYTTTDVTAYFITTSSHYFYRALSLLSDMMQHPALDPEGVKTEQGIIHHEMAMDEDDPSRELYLLFNNTAFQVHPVRYPTIGYRAQFDALTRDDILSYFNNHYTPGNTVLSVAGDVKAADVFAAAEKELGNWPSKIFAQPAIPSEPRQVSPRKAISYQNVQLSRAMMGWHTVRLQNPDLYPLDVMAQILGGADSSRLVRKLRDEKNLVTGVSAYSNTPNYDAGIFAVTAALPTKNLSAFQNGVWEQLEDIKKHGVTAEELALAKHQIDTAFIFNNSDVEQIAERIASDYISTGDDTFSQRYVQNIKNVTSAQIKEVAQKYFSRQNVTVAVVEPLANQPKTAAKAASDNGVRKPQMMTLSNGLRVILRENHTEPTVAITLTGNGGLLSETPHNEGIANLTAQMLQRGTTRRSFHQFSDIVDKLGGDFNSTSGYNSWVITSKWLAKDWRSGLSLVHEAAVKPAFNPSDLAQVKQLVDAGIKSQSDDPDTVAQLLALSTYYGDYPYGHSKLGTLNSIAKLNKSDLQNYWNTRLDPKKMVLSIYGDINVNDVTKVVDYLFGNLRNARTDSNKLATFTPPSKPLAKTQTMPATQQAVVDYVYPGITVNSTDRYAMTVMNAALAGIYYPGGRLFARLRDSQLVYSVFAFSQPGQYTGSFIVTAATTKDKIDVVKQAIEEELTKIKTSNITDEELARGKSMAIAAQDVALQGNQSQSQSAATDELLGLGFLAHDTYAANINKVTADQVREVAAKYLRDQNRVIAIAQPQ
jgi:zinc protease